MKSAINPIKSAINPIKSAINPMKSAINPMKSAINPMKSAINPMKSSLILTKSAINGILMGYSWDIVCIQGFAVEQGASVAAWPGRMTHGHRPVATRPRASPAVWPRFVNWFKKTVKAHMKQLFIHHDIWIYMVYIPNFIIWFIYHMGIHHYGLWIVGVMGYINHIWFIGLNPIHHYMVYIPHNTPTIHRSIAFWVNHTSLKSDICWSCVHQLSYLGGPTLYGYSMYIYIYILHHYRSILYGHLGMYHDNYR